MSRGANKENLATNTIGQAAFWNSGKGEPSARLKISTPYETKLQNFLKKSSVDQKNKLQAFDFKIKDQSYSIDSAYNVYTAELTQHTRLDQKKQSLDPRNERHSAVPFADRTAFHVNQDKTRSVTPQPNRSSSSKKETNARSPAQNAMNQSSGYSGTPNQLKGKTQKLSNGPVTLHSQGFEQIPLGYQYSGSQTRPRSAQKLTRSSSTQQQQSLMRGIQSATNSRSTNTILLSQTPSVYISSNESNFGSNPSQNSNWSSQQESQGTRKSSTAGVSQQQMGSYEQINPLLHQFLEETHLKELIQMDIEEFRRHRTQNRELEGIISLIVFGGYNICFYPLLAAVKQLTFELQNEKNKTTLLQNEIANLNGSMVEERSKYEAEIANMANQINQLKNVQNLYVGEKRTSELLENQLNAKEKKLQEITRFSR